MRRDLASAMLATLAASSPVRADEVPEMSLRLKAYSQSSVAGAELPKNPYSPGQPALVPGADPLLVGSSLDLLATAVSVKEKGTQFKATVTPGAAFDHYQDVVSETTLGFLTDTSSSLFRVTLASGYNAFALQGPQGKRADAKSNELFNCDALFDDRDACKKSCAEAFPADANHSKEVKDAKDARRKTCESSCDDALTRANVVCAKRLQAHEWSIINDSCAPSVSGSVSADLFPAGIGSASPPGSTGWGGVTVQLDLTFRRAEVAQIDVWGTYKPWWRSSGTFVGSSASGMGRYLGGGVTFSYLLSFLQRGDPQHDADSNSAWTPERYPDYVKSGFLPGVALGASVQTTVCLTGFCDQNREHQFSVTPFIDLRVKPELQFRLSIPLTYYSGPFGSGAANSVTLTLASAVGPVK